MILNIPKKITNKIRIESKRWFPKEFYTDLVGTISPKDKVLNVIGCWIPSDLDDYTSDSQVELPPHWRKESNKYAESIGGVIVGSAHSHPYSAKDTLCSPAYRLDASPSSADFESMGREIIGIVAVLENSEGKLSTTIKFYGPILKLDVKII